MAKMKEIRPIIERPPILVRFSPLKMRILNVLKEFSDDVVPINRLVAPSMCKNKKTLRTQISRLRMLTGHQIDSINGSYRLIRS